MLVFLRHFCIKAAVLALWLPVLVGAMACASEGKGIVYVSEEDGNAEIYVVDPESGDSYAVDPRPSTTESSPRWSPDGAFIAFVSGEPGNLHIAVASADGKEPVRQAYRSFIRSGRRRRFRRRTKSRLAGTPMAARSLMLPIWMAIPMSTWPRIIPAQSPLQASGREVRSASPPATRKSSWETGRRTVNGWYFPAGASEDSQGLWLRNPAGVNLFQLTSGNDLAPVWSPDGDAIAFVRNVDGNRDIYLLLPEDDDDWRGPVKAEPLITSPEADHSPAWAPDGDTLAYVSERDGNPEIYVIETDDDNPPLRLTTNEAEDSQPVWSPDGKRIAFVSDLHGEGEIFVMDADGSNQQRLTHNDTRDHSPDW